jgi:hypothetical protein
MPQRVYDQHHCFVVVGPWLLLQLLLGEGWCHVWQLHAGQQEALEKYQDANNVQHTE